MTAGNPGPVQPDRYAQLQGERDPVESMRKAPKRLKKLLSGVSEKKLAARPAAGGWSIKEIVAHLADGEVMLGSRFRMVAALERPQLIGYDQDAFAERLRPDDVRTKDLLEDFAAVRKCNVRLLKGLPREALARVGLHSERGEERLADMLVMYAGHDRVHEEQVTRLLESAARRPKDGKNGRRAERSGKPDRQAGKAAKPSKAAADNAKQGQRRGKAEPAGGSEASPGARSAG